MDIRNLATGGIGVPSASLGVMVFSATKAREREELGGVITDWLAKQEVTVTAVIQTQSSDNEFHGLVITIWYIKKGGK